MRKIAFVLTLGVMVYSNPAIAQDSTEVYKPDGTIQCERGKEISLTAMARDLRRSGIGILDSRKGHDGRYRMTMCGASTGNINIFSIFLRDFSEAEQIGFQIFTSIE
jgi:hypothetical protein